VPDHAAADAGDGAEEDGLHGTEIEVEGLARAGDAEDGEAYRVEEQHAALDALDRGSGKEAHGRRDGDPGHVAPVPAPRGGCPDEEVADAPAGQADNSGQDGYAEDIQARADGRQAAAEPEHEGAQQVQAEDQRRIKARHVVSTTWPTTSGSRRPGRIV